MKKHISEIIIKYITVEGMFGIKKQQLYEINENIDDFINKNNDLNKYANYCLFDSEDDLKICYDGCVPNTQLELLVNSKVLHIIRMPKYIKIDNSGKKALVKELLSYNYDGKTVDTLSNKKFEEFLIKEIGIEK